MKPEDFDLLVERQLDGSLSESEQERLADALGEHEWARDRFVGRMALAADLRDRLTPDAAPVPKVSIPFPKAGRMKWITPALAAAAVLMLGLFLIFQDSKAAPKVRVIAAEGVGTLNTEALENGEEISLQRGILELELNAESRVVIEAPATFSVLSPRRLRLTAGRCFAEMEKGKSGLRIETPSGEVLDLGTKFAVDVSSPSETNVHVFDGSVEVSDGSTEKQLTEGQAVRMAKADGLSDVQADSSLFVQRIPRGLADEAPYLHWSFDEGKGKSVRADGRGLDTALGIGSFSRRGGREKPAWIPGVSGSAIRFEDALWITTKHPGIAGNQDRTVACWVKLPPASGTSEVAPLISWGLRNKRAQSQAWVLSVASDQKKRKFSGVLQLDIGRKSTFGTTNLRDGRWHHVAAVSMNVGTSSAILLYVDGQLENAHRGLVADLETLTGEEGTYRVQFGRHLLQRGRFLHGSLDEFYLFGGALSGDEIRKLMDIDPLQP